MATHGIASARSITLGILAGGQGSRLGGRDKAWLERDGVPLVVALAEPLGAALDAVLVSANRHQERYLAHGLRVVPDRVAGAGPLAGLDALADACRTPWLCTLPVDLLQAPARLVERLSTVPGGAWLQDDDGAQPLVALWPVAALRTACAAALLGTDFAIRALQQRIGMAGVAMPGVRAGNLNTPADLVAAGIE